MVGVGDFGGFCVFWWGYWFFMWLWMMVLCLLFRCYIVSLDGWRWWFFVWGLLMVDFFVFCFGIWVGYWFIWWDIMGLYRSVLFSCLICIYFSGCWVSIYFRVINSVMYGIYLLNVRFSVLVWCVFCIVCGNYK